MVNFRDAQKQVGKKLQQRALSCTDLKQKGHELVPVSVDWLSRPLVSAKQRSRTASLHACVKCRTWTRGNYHRRCLGLRKVPLVVQSSAGKRLGACPQNRVALCTAWGISMMKPSLGIQRPRALTVGCQNILPATSGADSWFRRGLNLVLARSVCRNCALVALTVIVQTVVGPLWICSRPIPRFRRSACRKLVCGLISLLRSRLRPLGRVFTATFSSAKALGRSSGRSCHLGS